MKVFHLEREKLYEEVWREPITSLAKKYEISDVGLIKICKKLAIPTPGRGHWAKAYPAERPPLPINHSGPSNFEHRVLQKPDIPQSVSKEDPDEIRDLISYEKIPSHKIIVPERLLSPHPFVLQTKQILEEQKGDRYGRLYHYKAKYLNFHVTKAGLLRALRIMDALIKALEKRQMKVMMDTSKTEVSIIGQKLSIKIEEPVKQRQRELTPKEHQKLLEGGFVWDRYIYDPSGRLILKIDEWGSDIKKEWKDGKTEKIEDCLNDFIIGLIRCAYGKQLRMIADEKARLERQKFDQERYEKLRQIDEEKQELKQLEHEVAMWQKSQQIRAYVETVRQWSVEKRGPIEPESKLAQWIAWASAHADRFDPLTDNPPHILDAEAKLRGY